MGESNTGMKDQADYNIRKMGKAMRDFSGMRDCVRDVFQKGCTKALRRQAKFWVISELKRLGYTETLKVQHDLKIIKINS